MTNALFLAAPENAEIATTLDKATREFIEALERELQATYTHTQEESIAAVATAIAALYFNFETMQQLGDVEELAARSRQAVDGLLQNLES